MIISDIDKILKRNEEAGIRSNIHTPCIDDEKEVQRLGRHYTKVNSIIIIIIIIIIINEL